MHATLLRGGASHKGSANWVVRLYYRRAVLFIVCSGNELWYVAMYALHFGGGPFLPAPLDHLRVFEAIGYAATPFFAFKQVRAPVPTMPPPTTPTMAPANRSIATSRRSGGAPIALTARPRAQFTNAVQLFSACAELVDADAEAAAERATTAGRRVTRSRSKKQ